MKLRIDDITAESRTLSYSEPEQEINRALSTGPVHEYRLLGPVGVEVAHYRAGTELFLEGTIEAAASANCARCAEEFATTSRRPFRYVLAPKSVAADDGSDPRVEDLEFALYDGDYVDLTPLVREQVLLALAERPLCGEDCKGLCPTCGANLNQGACGCRKEQSDPRLAVLRNLKIGRAS
jgi:uncharacterized protein